MTIDNQRIKEFRKIVKKARNEGKRLKVVYSEVLRFGVDLKKQLEGNQLTEKERVNMKILIKDIGELALFKKALNGKILKGLKITEEEEYYRDLIEENLALKIEMYKSGIDLSS